MCLKNLRVLALNVLKTFFNRIVSSGCRYVPIHTNQLEVKKKNENKNSNINSNNNNNNNNNKNKKKKKKKKNNFNSNNNAIGDVSLTNICRETNYFHVNIRSIFVNFEHFAVSHFYKEGSYKKCRR